MVGVAPSPDHETTHTPVVAVVGATASGKSALALALAESLPIGIVNADAMQLYRGMDIGTAKPTTAERRRVPHYGLDLLEISQAASVAQFRQYARTCIAGLADQGRLPVVVGGSALYLRAVLDQLDIPPTDPQVRERWNLQLKLRGSADLHEELRAVAPQAAAEIDPRNGRRIVRAMEVVELTGSFTARLPEPVSWRPTLWLGLRPERADLDIRISQRVEHMWQEGLVAEVARLQQQGLAHAPTASRAVGYQQVLEFLAGEVTAADAKVNMVAVTKKLARRQERTFRANTRIQWLDSSSDPQTEALERIANLPRVE